MLDFVGVLVHEFLHSLGLGHPDDSEMNLCEPGSYTETDAAVMATGNKDYRRRLRRDDIEGLRELYGAPERSLYYSESETSPDPPGALDWPGPIVVDPSIRTNTPVAASDAGHFALENTFVGFTNEDDEVRFFSGPWFGWSGNAANGGDAILDSNNAPVRSWDSVEASLGSFVDGSERRLVAWISGPEESCCSGESEMGQDVRIWWRIFSNGSWKAPQSTGLTKYKTFGASYDRREDVFVLAYIDSWPVEGDLPENQRIFVRTINSWSGGGGCTQALTTVEHVLAVGGVACDDRMGTLPTGATRCAIAVSTTDDALADEEAGPRLRFIEGEITEHDGFICFVRDDWEDDPTVVPLTTELTSLGNVDVAMDGHTPNGALLGSYVPAVPEPFDGDSEPSPERNIFTMTRDLEGKLTGPVANQRSFNSDFWPLTLSTQTRTTGPSHTRWRVFMYGSDGGAGVGGMLVAAIALAVLLGTIALLIYKRRFFRL